MISSVFKTKKLVFVRKGTLFMTAETEAIKAQILSTGNAEILLEENDFLIVKWIKPEIKYSMAAYQYGKTGMANNYPCDIIRHLLMKIKQGVGSSGIWIIIKSVVLDSGQLC